MLEEDKSNSIDSSEHVQSTDELVSLKCKIDKLKSQLAYSQADLDNYKKRCQREKADIVAKAYEDFANDIFPIIDSFEMASETLKMSGFMGNQSVLSGIQMVMSQLEATLKKHGFEKADVKVGNAFDVNLCEAVSTEDSSQEANAITRMFCSGWLHDGKLVRPAKVAVAK